MVSRRQIVAIIVIAIIVSTGGLYIFLNQPPNLSLADKMILQPGDSNISGFRSSSKSQSPLQYANESSNCREWLSNETIDLILWIHVFNSTDDSRATFFDVIHSLSGERGNITLGDDAIYWPQGPKVPSVIFVKSNVMAWVQILSQEVDYTWLHNATIALAQLQLEKIDLYLTL